MMLLAINIALLIAMPDAQLPTETGFIAATIDGGMPLTGAPYTMTFFDEQGAAIATMNVSE